MIVIIENLRIQNWKMGFWNFLGLGITYGVLEFRSVWAGLNLLTLTLAWTLYKPIGLCFFRVGPLTTLILTLPPLASRWRLYSRGELPMNSWLLISHHASFSLSLMPQHSSNHSILRPKSQSIFLSCWSSLTFSSGACYILSNDSLSFLQK